MSPSAVPSSLVDVTKVVWYLFFLPVPSLLKDGMLRCPAHGRRAIGGKEILSHLHALAHAGLSAWNAPSHWGSFKAQMGWDGEPVLFSLLNSKILKVRAISRSPLLPPCLLQFSVYIRSVSVGYCCLTNHPKLKMTSTVSIY